jgi:anaerobic selenocysteine-containing dehydrogenase
VSADDAEARGVRDGEYVDVYNDVADFRCRVMVSPGVRPGQVIIYHGWENYQFQDWHPFKGVMASPMNPIELVGGYGQLRRDPIVGAPGLSDRDTRVEIRRVN